VIPTCFPAVSLRTSGDPQSSTGIVCPDHALTLLLPSHRPSFDHHSTGIQAQWRIRLLTDHVMDMRGRGYKAMSGNCCYLLQMHIAAAHPAHVHLLAVQARPWGGSTPCAAQNATSSSGVCTLRYWAPDTPRTRAAHAGQSMSSAAVPCTMLT
jgi:hypothetical protein